MRIYLSEKRTVEDKEYHPGFYPSGRVPVEKAQEWVNEGIACPATDDNKTQWQPEPEPKSAIGLIEDDEPVEDYNA